MSTLLQGANSLFRGIKGLWNKITGAGVTPAQRDTMAFNAEQAELDRSFQSAEAEKARQWQEEYYTQYQSPAALVRQYEDAGLNPALMYGGGSTSAATPPSTSTPSGASASVGMPSDGESLLSFIASIITAKSQINKNNAEANQANANANEANQRVEWNPRRWESEINERVAHTGNMLAGVELLQSQVNESLSRIKLTDAQVNKVIADTDNTVVDTAKKELEKKGVEFTNQRIAAQIVQTYAETRLANAQAMLANSNAKVVDLQAFVQQLDAQQAAASGGSRAKNWTELMDKVASNIVIESGKALNGLKSLWDTIF